MIGTLPQSKCKVGALIQVLAKISEDTHKWVTAKVTEIDEESGVGTATYHDEMGRGFDYEFACVGFKHDPRVRQVPKDP